MAVEDYVDRLISPDRSRAPRRRRRPSQPQLELSPVERQSLIGRAGGSALSGLSALGNLLDLPGSMVRDVVSAKNPFDQLLDPLGRRADQNRTSGRDLLRSSGAVGRRNNWGNFVGGLATQIALDPLTYLTFGASALSKAGKVAHSAGKLAPTLRGQIEAGHRGLVGLRLPFAQQSVSLGTGSGAQAIAGGIDRAVNSILYGRAGRLASRLLDSEVGETSTPEVQKLSRGLAPQRRDAEATSKLFSARTARDLVDSGLADPKHGDALRRALEGTSKASDPSFDPDMLRRITQENENLLAEAQSLGMDVEAFRDSTNLGYFQRYLSAEGGSKMFKNRVLSTTDPSEIGRAWYMRDIQGGTDTIQQIARDADVEAAISSGAKPTAVRNIITSKFGNVFLGNTKHSPAKHGTRFAESLMGMAPETRQAGVFGKHPIADMAAGMQSRRDAITVSRGIVDFIKDADFLADVPGPETMPVNDLMKSLKMSGAKLPDKHIPREIAADLKRLHEGFTAPESVNAIVDTVDRITNLFKAGVTGIWPAFHTRNFTSGQWQNFIAGTFSPGSVTDAHTLMRGGTIRGAAQIPIVKSELARRGLAATDENASKALADLAYAHDIIGRYEGQAADVGGAAANAGVREIGDVLDAIPGMSPVRQPFQGGSSFNPLNVRGAFSPSGDSTFHLAKWGENIGHYVEGLNRLSPFIQQLRRGVNPALAAQKIGAAQVLYQNKYFTRFESQALARLLPFYKFTARQIPFQLRMLADQPGGKLAQTVRTINRGRQPDEITPDYISETASIPLGTREDGSKSFLTGFGLPIEDTASLLTPDLQSLGLEFLSRTNPFVKAPLEYATGQSFFQRGPTGGRPLEDLDPTIGRTIANVREMMGAERPRRAEPFLNRGLEFLFANSPLSRGLTAARTATDQRKTPFERSLNLLTGSRISDVSPAAQDAILRERIEQSMKALGGRSFERMSIPLDVIASLPPEQQMEALRLKALLQEITGRTRARNR